MNTNYFTSEHQLFRKSLRDFLDREIVPHIDEWDLEGSPEISVLWCLEDRDEKSNIIFEYEFGRNKKLRYKVELTKDNLIIFPSYMRHKITKNRNKEPIVALSFQFQLL